MTQDEYTPAPLGAVPALPWTYNVYSLAEQRAVWGLITEMTRRYNIHGQIEWPTVKVVD